MTLKSILALALIASAFGGTKVDHVVDGDTFVKEDGKSVRLLGINAVEVGQPGADIAKAFLESMILGKEVTLETDSVEHDNFGRLLAHVWIDTVYVNGRMVRKGYTQTYFVSPNRMYNDHLLQLERDAERARRGLWALGAFQFSDISLSSSSEDTVPPEDLISWEDAADYIGKVKTVEGEVVASYNSGKTCFLNFHPDYQNHFTAVIFASDFDKFPPEPEELYLRRTVRIRGLIKEYKGKPEIILQNPEQIRIVK
jgi:micrococcal nuclease